MGAALAIDELWIALSQAGDPWTHILLAAMSVGLAMLGPGAWSIDAHLFGRKLLDIGDRARKR